MDGVEIILSRSGVASMVSGFLEGVGIPWPGAVVLTAAGAESSGASAPILVALCFGVLYTASAWLQYILGRYCWHRLARFLPAARQRKLQALMRKHGEFAVLWSRPLAIGNYISLAAGMVRMPLGRFLLFTFLGIMPWALAMTFGGSYLGAHLTGAGKLLAAAAGFMAVLGGLRLLHKRVRIRRLAREELTEVNLRSFAD